MWRQSFFYDILAMYLQQINKRTDNYGKNIEEDTAENDLCGKAGRNTPARKGLYSDLPHYALDHGHRRVVGGLRCGYAVHVHSADALPHPYLYAPAWNKSSLRVPDDARHTRQLCHHRHGSSTSSSSMRIDATSHSHTTKNADVTVGVFYLHSVQFTSHRPQPRTAVHEIFQVRSQRIS